MTHSFYRILDANLNRLREALRVLEEYCRFHQNHSQWSTQFKELRHQLLDYERYFPLLERLIARDTLNDVGTTIEGTHEFHRETLLDTLQANFNRAKEALRVLEEYSKIQTPEASHLLEKQRYLLYQLEAEILTTSLRKSLHNKYLYALFTPSQCKEPYLDVAKKLIDGGLQVLQLREKKMDDHDLFQVAETLKKLLQGTEVVYLINDRPDIAHFVEADGVHLGQTDLPSRVVRHNFPHFLIGVSTHHREEAIKAAHEDADYIGIGPIFPSRTKAFDSFAGLSYITEAKQYFSGPQFALGGIDTQNVGEVLKAGASRIALSSALLHAENIVQTTQFFRNLLDAQNRANPSS